MRFGFLLKRGKPEAAEIGAELASLLVRRGVTVVVADEDAATIPRAKAVPSEKLGSEIDVLVVLGGDGTFLHGASLVADHGVPLLGINLGSLGFMTHYALEEARDAIEAASAGKLPIDERMRLRVGIRRAGAGTPEEIESRTALNEAVITQRSIARLLDLEAQLDGSSIARYKADGLIVSTPTGSTAYNLAAGGPILTPDLEAIVLTPICPHTLTNRPVVMRGGARIVVTNVSGSSVTLTVDGQWSRELGPSDSIEVQKAERPLRTFRPPSAFFAILRKKLSWGERPG
jgi:NAD+ kinase